MSANQTQYSIVSNAAYLLKHIWRHRRLLFVFLVAEAAIGSILPLYMAFLPRIAVDLAAEGAAPERVLAVLGGAAALYILLRTINNTCSQAKRMHYTMMRFDFQKDILDRFQTCDYVQIESAQGQTRYQRACSSVDGGDSAGSARMVSSGMELIMTGVSFILFAGMIALLNPLITVGLVLLTCVNYLAVRAGRIFEHENRPVSAELEKKLHYIQRAPQRNNSYKDTRIYGMKPWFSAIREGVLNDYARVRQLIAGRHYALSFVTLTSNLLRDFGAVAYTAYMFQQGRITSGDFVFYLGLIAAFSGLLNGIINHYNTLQDASKQMNELREFLDITDEPEIANPAQPPDGSLGINFKNVCFSYDGQTNVIDNFNFQINPGEKLALVGVNGAGKTTLVKLLCGFYKSTSGSIEIGGVDISRFCRGDLTRLFSVVFQDVTLFPFTVAENVSLQSQTDETRVTDCLARSGLLPDLADRGGIHAIMQSWFHENGIELSGGQQQKLLMARALYKDAPILILDEPTAALDPIAEKEVYESFHENTMGKTAIFISHRLASARFCDKIIFLEDGKVAETGTHDALLAQNGGYAHMYELQSHYYKEGGGDNA